MDKYDHNKLACQGELDRWLSIAAFLPSNPLVLLLAIETIEDSYKGATDLEYIIGLDQGLSLRVLRLAGSAAYGDTPPETLNQAIMKIGFEKIHDLIHRVFLRRRKLLSLPPEARRMFVDFWTHSILASIAAMHLKRRTGSDSPLNIARARLLGLVHDAGRLLLLVGDHRQHQKIVHGARQGHLGQPGKERKAFQITHEELGGHLTRKWNLGEEIGWAMAAHHDPSRAPHRHQMVRLVHLADWIALKIQEEWLPDMWDPDRGAMRTLNLRPPDLRIAMTATRKEWQILQDYLQNSSPITSDSL